MSDKRTIFGGPQGICPICTDNHSSLIKCDHNVLIHIIKTMKAERISLMKANYEAVDVARAFQKIIRDIEPEVSRLAAVELQYKNLLRR